MYEVSLYVKAWGFGVVSGFRFRALSELRLVTARANQGHTHVTDDNSCLRRP